MKALFTSDVHADMDAWRRYAQTLALPEYDFGLLGGDLTDDSLTIQTIRDPSAANELEPLEELYVPDDTTEDLNERVIAYKKDPNAPLARAALALELERKQIISSASKPMFLIPGNHDLSDWRETKTITNVHQRRVEYGGLNIVGYRFTDLDRSDEDEAHDVEQLGPLVDRRTILLTHAPPFRLLDRTYRPIPIGSKAIRALAWRRRPMFHLFGPVHDSFGTRGRSANGARACTNAFIRIDSETRCPGIVAIYAVPRDTHRAITKPSS